MGRGRRDHWKQERSMVFEKETIRSDWFRNQHARRMVRIQSPDEREEDKNNTTIVVVWVISIAEEKTWWSHVSNRWLERPTNSSLRYPSPKATSRHESTKPLWDEDILQSQLDSKGNRSNLPSVQLNLLSFAWSALGFRKQRSSRHQQIQVYIIQMELPIPLLPWFYEIYSFYGRFKRRNALLVFI